MDRLFFLREDGDKSIYHQMLDAQQAKNPSLCGAFGIGPEANQRVLLAAANNLQNMSLATMQAILQIINRLDSLEKTLTEMQRPPVGQHGTANLKNHKDSIAQDG